MKQGKRSGWFDPYFPTQGNAKPRPQMADSWLSKKSGIYFIKHKATGAVVYVGMSKSQLKKTMYRHFQEWNDRARKALWGTPERKTYPKHGYQVRFIYCGPSRAAYLEKKAIAYYKPKDNTQDYSEAMKAINEAGEKLSGKAKGRFKKDWDFDENGEIIPIMKKADYLEDPPF